MDGVSTQLGKGHIKPKENVKKSANENNRPGDRERKRNKCRFGKHCRDSHVPSRCLPMTSRPISSRRNACSCWRETSLIDSTWKSPTAFPRGTSCNTWELRARKAQFRCKGRFQSWIQCSNTSTQTRRSGWTCRSVSRGDFGIQRRRFGSTGKTSWWEMSPQTLTSTSFSANNTYIPLYWTHTYFYNNGLYLFCITRVIGKIFPFK